MNDKKLNMVIIYGVPTCNKFFSGLLVFTFMFFSARAQNDNRNNSTANVVSTGSQSQKPLLIGDYLPELEFTSLINYKANRLTSSELRGKVVIFDFWATWCSPCIAAFPKLDSLQKMFGDQLLIIPVTSEDREKVVPFLQKMKKVLHVMPMSVTNDTIMRKLFSHRTIPHYVWLNKEMRVVAVTEGAEITSSNIRQLLSDTLPSLKEKKEDLGRKIFPRQNKQIFHVALNSKSDFSDKPTLFSLSDSAIFLQSILTGYIEGLGGSEAKMGGNIISARNLSIKWLYRIALLGNSLETTNRKSMEVEVGDSVLLERITGIKNGQPISGMEYDTWIRTNGYSYELSVPASLRQMKFDLMLDELNRYFGALYGVEGVVEKRASKYLALVRVSEVDNLSTKGGTSVAIQNKFYIKIRNKKLSYLTAALAIPLQNYPIIVDETDFKGYVDLDLNCQISDLDMLRKELYKYGLNLEEKEKVMNVAVLKQK